MTVHLPVLPPTRTRSREAEAARSLRKRDVRAHTLNTRRMLRDRAAMPVELIDVEGYERPRTRGDCVDGDRPCPFVSCVHHLYLDVSPRTGSIKINFPDLEPDELSPSCALDVAERGGVILERFAEYMNLTRERIRQYEQVIFRKLARLSALRRLAEGSL